MGWLNNFYRKLHWGLLGIVISMIFGFFGLYSIFHENKPNISFKITNEANILDLHKPLEELSISFQGEDIQKKNLNLRILTIKIENDGKVNILQNFYDSEDIWGFQVKNGKIIEVRWVNANSEYLKLNLNPQLINDNTVQFKKVIFEKTRYFILEILVLHTKTILPEIIPLGKIAGIENIVPIKSWQEKERQSFLSKLFYGKFIVQIVRPIIYLILWVALIFVIIGVVAGIGSIKKKLKKVSRIKTVTKYFGKQAIEKEGEKKRILDIYVERGPDALKRLQKILADKDKLLQEVRRYSYLKGAQESIKEKPPVEVEAEYYEHLFLHEVIQPLIEKSIITAKSDKEIQLNTEFSETLNKLLGILSKKGY